MITCTKTGNPTRRRLIKHNRKNQDFRPTRSFPHTTSIPFVIPTLNTVEGELSIA